MRVRTAVFPVAGLGTRFLPATKAIPKEVLPLVDRPLIQYAVDEALSSGIEQLIFVTARGKSALEDYFDSAPELERALREKGKNDLLAALSVTDMPSGSVAYVRQSEALGLGHAVACARNLVGNEPFAVILPDDVVDAERPCLAQMIEAYHESGIAARGGSMLAMMKVSKSEIDKYGVASPAVEWNGSDPVVPLSGLVEKPSASNAPSDLAVIGRYILGASVMPALSRVRKGAGGEIQLTDAIASEIARGVPVSGFRFKGSRFDCGSKAGYLAATVSFGLARADLRDDLRAHMTRALAAENMYDTMNAKKTEG